MYKAYLCVNNQTDNVTKYYNGFSPILIMFCLKYLFFQIIYMFSEKREGRYDIIHK